MSRSGRLGSVVSRHTSGEVPVWKGTEMDGNRCMTDLGDLRDECHGTYRVDEPTSRRKLDDLLHPSLRPQTTLKFTWVLTRRPRRVSRRPRDVPESVPFRLARHLEGSETRGTGTTGRSGWWITAKVSGYSHN